MVMGRVVLIAMVEAINATIDEAYDAAMSEYRGTEGGYPAGFSWVKGADGRTREVKKLKEDPRFDIRSGATGGTIVAINAVQGQSLYPKSNAYKAFLEVMQDSGYLEGASVYSRWD